MRLRGTLAAPAHTLSAFPAGLGASRAFVSSSRAKTPRQKSLCPQVSTDMLPGAGGLLLGAWIEAAFLGAQEVQRVDSLFLPPDEDCPLEEASSRKIPRLTVKVRRGSGSPARSPAQHGGRVTRSSLLCRPGSTAWGFWRRL